MFNNNDHTSKRDDGNELLSSLSKIIQGSNKTELEKVAMLGFIYGYDFKIETESITSCDNS